MNEQKTQQEPSEAEQVCHETYAVLGALLLDLAEQGHTQAEKLLDNLAEARLVHRDVVPWDFAASPSVNELGKKEGGAPGVTDAERAAWLADKIPAGGDYAKEAAAMLRRWPDGAPVADAIQHPSTRPRSVDGGQVAARAWRLQVLNLARNLATAQSALDMEAHCYHGDSWQNKPPAIEAAEKALMEHLESAAGMDGAQAADHLREQTSAHGHCPDCHALCPQHHANCPHGVQGPDHG